eukprot:Nitzschia sp. Nitz4//scaffold39_size137210//107111//107704//NITZ4_003216-RA/size137210-processed-gene-0.125-mRNA-1//-1//CDS//3329550434//8421//frame0
MDPSTTTNDSLPYIEAVHEDYEEYGLALIEEEMQQTQPRVLRKLPDIRFRTPMMKAEYEARVVDGQYVKREDNSYHPLKIARPNSLDEWRSVAIPQAKAQFEAERLRGLLLDAEKDDAVAHWQTYNSQILAPLHAQVTATLASQREAVEDVNFQRQQLQQQQWAPELEQLNTDYQQMLYRRNQLEHANEGLRRESRQ